jgi:PKD repeat protein
MSFLSAIDSNLKMCAAFWQNLAAGTQLKPEELTTGEAVKTLVSGVAVAEAAAALAYYALPAVVKAAAGFATAHPIISGVGSSLGGSAILASCGSVEEFNSCDVDSNPSISGVFDYFVDGQPVATNEIIQGDTVTVVIAKSSIERCDGSGPSGSLKVWFTVNDRNEKIAAQSDNDNYYIIYTFTRTGENIITFYVDDTKQSDASPVEKTETVYVNSTAGAITIGVVGGEDGLIARRPVALSANWQSTTPEGDWSFAWEILDQDDNVVKNLNGQEVEFTPQLAGLYQAKVLASKADSDQTIEASQTFEIYPFPVPGVVISGNFYPDPGEGIDYYAKFDMPKERPEPGPEEDAAMCFWSLSHNGIDDVENDALPCAGPFHFDFPPDEITEPVSYKLLVEVVGGDNAYTTGADEIVTLEPGSASGVVATFSWTDDGVHGLIPFYPIEFNASLTPPPEGTVTYNWEITDAANNPVLPPPAAGNPMYYSFGAAGFYHVTLTALDAYGNLIDDVTYENVQIYPFPEPSTDMDVNQSQPIFVQEPATFTALIARAGGLWAEDQAALYAWEISHYDDVLQQTVIDQTWPASADNQTISYSFSASHTYTVAATIIGMHGATEAYTTDTIKFVDVYTHSGSLPSAVIGENLLFAYHLNDIAYDITGYSDDPAATFNWIITTPVGVLPTITDQQVIPSFQFDHTGNYAFKLEVVAGDGYTKNYYTRNVEVYPATVRIPSIAIAGPRAVHVGESHSYTGTSDDPGATYDWEITYPDGTVDDTTFAGMQSIPSLLFDQEGDYALRLTVTASDGQTQNSKIYDVSAYAVSSPIPSAVISSNLKYSYHLYDSVNNITGYSDDPAATFNWTVTYPDGTLHYFLDQQTILSFLFELEGDYDFKLEVVAGDDSTKNYEIRSVGVYDALVELPVAGIVGPTHGSIGEDLHFAATDPDESQYSYTWVYGDGTTASGATPPPKQYSQTGTYPVQLTVARLNDPTIKDTVTWHVAIGDATYVPPAFDLSGLPNAAEVGTVIPMTLAFQSGDPDDWTVTWQYGDGSPLGQGLSVNHTYETTGPKNLVITLTNVDPDIDPIYVSWPISIIEHGKPIPNLTITPSNMGPVPLTITADASNSYASAPEASIVYYSFNWGDGSAEQGGPYPSRNHTYDLPGTYTLRLTITDSNNQTSTITTVISTWE